MKNWKAITGVVLVFVLGAICGGAVTHMMQRSRLETFGGRSPAAREELLVKRLTRSLDLDSSQVEQVRPIVHEAHATVRQIRQQCRPQIEATFEESQRRISAVLRPEQREKLEKIIAERKERRRSREGN